MRRRPCDTPPQAHTAHGAQEQHPHTHTHTYACTHTHAHTHISTQATVLTRAHPCCCRDDDQVLPALFPERPVAHAVGCAGGLHHRPHRHGPPLHHRHVRSATTFQGRPSTGSPAGDGYSTCLDFVRLSRRTNLRARMWTNGIGIGIGLAHIPTATPPTGRPTLHSLDALPCTPLHSLARAKVRGQVRGAGADNHGVQLPRHRLPRRHGVSVTQEHPRRKKEREKERRKGTMKTGLLTNGCRWLTTRTMHPCRT